MQKLFLTTLVLALPADVSADESMVAGSVATFRDDVRSVSEVVMLPELGLAADESPHPAIKPAFTFRFEGFLEVAQVGTCGGRP